MSLIRRAKKRDSNEGVIVEVLEKAGFEVHRLDKPCDLLVLRRNSLGRGQLLEVKDPKARVDKRQKEQISFLERTGTPVVRSPEDALRVVGALAQIR